MTGPELFAAIDAGDAEAARRLLADDPTLAGARDPQGVSAVLRARYRNRLDIVDLLLAAGPDLDVHDAAGLGRLDRLVAVLDENPDALDALSSDGFTPLHLAAFFGHPAGVGLLLERGARAGVVASNLMRIQALHAAAAGGSHEALVLLLEAGADPDGRQEGGHTPLMAVAALGQEAGVDALLERGADPALRNDEGRDAADVAAERGHQALADRLRALARG